MLKNVAFGLAAAGLLASSVASAEVRPAIADLGVSGQADTAAFGAQALRGSASADDSNELVGGLLFGIPWYLVAIGFVVVIGGVAAVAADDGSSPS